MGRESRDAHVSGERHEPDAQPPGGAVEERLRRLLRRPEPRGRDVPGEHRAGRVEHEDDRRVLDRQRPRHLRSRDGEAEEAEHDEDERGDDPLAERRDPGRHTPEHVEVRVADGVPGPTAPHEEIGAHGEWEHHEREERKRTLESHVDPPIGGSIVPRVPFAKHALDAAGGRERAASRLRA